MTNHSGFLCVLQVEELNPITFLFIVQLFFSGEILIEKLSQKVTMALSGAKICPDS